MITILSMFNNAESYIERYFAQINDIEQDIFLILLEGDSTDNTFHLLNQNMQGRKGIILKCDMGKVYGSVTDPARFKQLAFLWNKMIELIPEETELVAFIEADLIWNILAFETLRKSVETYDVVCPLVICGNYFYDTYAYRYSEHKSLPSNLESIKHEVQKLYSAGSFLLMKYKTLGSNKLTEKNAFIGLCEQIGGVWLIPIYIFHPHP